MADEQRHMVVLQDAAGEYYVLPVEVLEGARVPAEDRDAVARALAGDVSGFILCNGLRSVPIQCNAQPVRFLCDAVRAALPGGFQVAGFFPVPTKKQ